MSVSAGIVCGGVHVPKPLVFAGGVLAMCALGAAAMTDGNVLGTAFALISSAVRPVGPGPGERGLGDPGAADTGGTKAGAVGGSAARGVTGGAAHGPGPGAGAA